MTNQILAHYHLKSKIGDGRFASVYLAHDIRLDRLVAVKVLKQEDELGTGNWGRVLREARIGSTLNHPNICAIHDVGEDSGWAFIVLELVQGRTLKSILDAGALPTRIALQIALDIGEALSHAHSAGVLHADLAPSNVMVTPRGGVKVIDFGLARALNGNRRTSPRDCSSSLEGSGYLRGTLPYTAPEILRGERASVQSDLWSLGVILYEMLLGSLPFPGRTPFEVGTAVMTASMQPISRQVPSALRALICRSLSAAKRNRYISAEELCLHLRGELSSSASSPQFRSWAAKTLLGPISSILSTGNRSK